MLFPTNDDWVLRQQVGETASRGLRMVAQEIVAPPPGGFFSVCSYLDAAGRARGVFVGRKLEQYPPGFGTSCLADAGLRVLGALGYHGISEVEFVWDEARGQHLLLDVNPRPWKWIGGESPRAKEVIAAFGDGYVMHGDPPEVIAAKVADMRARRSGAGGSPLGFGVSGFVICRDTEAQRIRAYEDAGVDLLLLQFSPQREEMARFAERVIRGMLPDR